MVNMSVNSIFVVFFFDSSKEDKVIEILAEIAEKVNYLN